MIQLTVVSLNGAPLAAPLSASFDELGGAIGRADSNQLVLPDEERVISRLHAQVVYRSGAFAVVARGANPIQVNGRAYDNGREAPLGDGDQLQIGPYLLRARLGAQASSQPIDDPFADLLGAPPAPAPSRASIPSDPLSAFARAPAASQAPAAPGGGIPDDWDPFAPNFGAPAPAPPDPFGRAAPARNGMGSGAPARHLGLDPGAAAPGALIPGMGSGAGGGGSDSLDALFGLGASTGADPLRGSALNEAAAKPNMAASADPMRSLMAAPRATAPTLPDFSSDLQQAFVAPNRPVAAPRMPAVAAPAPAPVAPVARPLPAAAVMSWDTPDAADQTMVRAAAPPPVDHGATIVRPAQRAQRVAPEQPPTLSVAPSAAPARVAPAAPVAMAPSAPTGMAAAGGADPLLAAFLEGLNTPGVQVKMLTPGMMRLIGELLHASVHGTVDLLLARAALKREVRAEATTISMRENNPLKFSADGDAALQHLLAPSLRGFMAPGAAMRDAYSDLRAHQFAQVYAMRAALEGVLGRFDPAQMEAEAGQSSGLQSLLSGSRKTRLWEIFKERHAQLRDEASDDFQSLFGAAFLRAYNDYNNKLKSEDE